jgi:hypothetical protein
MPQITKADIASTSDHTDMLLTRLRECAYPTAEPLDISQGVLTCSAPLVMGQSAWIRGAQGCDGGTTLSYTGADVPMIGNDALKSLSRVRLESLRFSDKRVGATTGCVRWDRVHNNVSIHKCHFDRWPGHAIYIGAPSGSSSDCIEIDAWIVFDKPGSAGILLERLDNNVSIKLRADTAGGGAAITVQYVAPDNAVLDISGKHEVGDAASPFLLLPTNTYGNIRLHDVVQRCPKGVASDIVVMGNSTAPRLMLQNTTGTMHRSGSAGVLYQRDRGCRLYAPVFNHVVQP